MSEESVFSLQKSVVECRQDYPGVIDKRYEEMYKLKDKIIHNKIETFKKEQTCMPKDFPNLNWPENLDWKAPESIDEKMLGKIKEQISLMILLQKEEKHPVSKIINSVCKK